VSVENIRRKLCCVVAYTSRGADLKQFLMKYQGAFKMDGWGVSTEKDDPVKYEHDEITCKSSTFQMALFCAEKVDFLLEPVVPNVSCDF
jgi:hypothetical protein